MNEGDRVRLVSNERFPILGTVRRVSRTGYVYVWWDADDWPDAHFSPWTAPLKLTIVTGEAALPRHDWDCELNIKDPRCLKCGVIQTDQNDLEPCR